MTDKSMNLKTAITAGLLLFVAASIATPIIRHVTAARRATADTAPRRPDALLVYYFRANVRCAACRTLEACSREVVAERFSAEAADGRIEWRAIDYQSPGNEHLLADYRNCSPAASCSCEFRDGHPQRWTALPETWNMTGDRAGLSNYLEDRRSCRVPGGDGPGAAAMNLEQPSAAMAFGLGLWTAVQPCPMTANLAAVSYLGRRAGSPGGALFAALLYAAGQMIAYVLLAFLVLEGIAADWRLAEWFAAARQPGPRAGLDPCRDGPLGPASLPLAGSSGRAESGNRRSTPGGRGARCRWGSSWPWGFAPYRPRSSSWTS